ncbi:hypothetical protein LOD99_12666 [Oopsacas minuta]|uniref:Uncharacterized protein n=1 Tax=Oopsacas minuta TaxID=111878 RepID=A0AAV7JCP4_9METZ|nr:hypothetical protein LOD99_12666 [Oopsacas minuta]
MNESNRVLIHNYEELAKHTTELSKALLTYAGLPVLAISGVFLSALWSFYMIQRMKVARNEYQIVKRNSDDHMNYDMTTKSFRIMSVYYSFMMMICVSEFFCCSLTLLAGVLFVTKPYISPTWGVNDNGTERCIANILLDVSMREIYLTIPMHVQVTLYLTILGLIRMLVYYLRDSYRNERSFGWSYFKLYGLFMSGRIMTYFFFAGVLQTLPFAIIWFTVFIIYESFCIIYGCVGLQRILRKRYELAMGDSQGGEVTEWMWRYIKFAFFNPVLNICLTLFSITEFLFVFGFFFAMLVNTECWIQVAFGSQVKFSTMSVENKQMLVLVYQIMYNIIADFAYIGTMVILGIPFIMYSLIISINIVLRACRKKRIYGDNSWLAERLLNAPLKERRPKEIF